MPCYIGGKFRNCKDIKKAIMLDIKDEEIKGFIEPFCGGLNVTKEFYKDYNCFCFDNNEDLIYMWNYIKNNVLPDIPIISKEKYKELINETELSFEKSFASFFCTFSSIYKGSYINDHKINKKSSTIRYYHKERYNGIKKIENLFKSVNFQLTDYKNITKYIDISQGGYIIYCDPPYLNTLQGYANKNIFDSLEFWNTAKKWKEMGNYVYVSELSIPDDINNKIIFEKNINIPISQGRRVMNDKLFKLL